MCLIWVSEENGGEAIFTRIRTKENPYQETVKLYTTKEVILKAARENSQIIYKGVTIRLTAHVYSRQNNVLPLRIAKISTLLSKSECVILTWQKEFCTCD